MTNCRKTSVAWGKGRPKGIHLAGSLSERPPMKSTFLALLFCTSIAGFSQNITTPQRSNKVRFEENLGQVKDQHWHPREDVLFSGSTQGINFHIRANGISYQLSRTEQQLLVADGAQQPRGSGSKMHDELPATSAITSHRIDIDWVAPEHVPVINTEGEIPGYTNYYNVPEHSAPALLVKSYSA